MRPVEEKIHLALKERSKTLAHVVAYPGEAFSPGNAYIRFGEVFADPAIVYVSDGQPYLRSGFLMLTFVAKVIAGVQSQTYMKQAGLIAHHYNDSVKMHFEGLCVSIPGAPSILTAYEEDGYWNIPVRVPWRCFA